MRILVALDSSPRAAAVLAAAYHLVRLAKGNLVLYRAVGLPIDLPRDLLNVTEAQLESRLLDDARADLRRLAILGDIPTERIDRVTVGFATAWDGICRTAGEENADLIVIGAHGYSTLDRVLGTTASKVVNRADRNVLVVRAPL